jgi:CrcB protein
MGLLAGWLLRHSGNEPARLLLGVGLLGGFTTMSAFALDTAELWLRSPVSAAGYALATIAGSLGAVAVGLLLTR